MEGYKPIKLETRKTQSRINNYVKKGKITKIHTDQGVMYNVAEFEKCLEENPLKTSLIDKKIYQEDINKEPYSELYRDFAHASIAYQRTVKNGLQKCFNTVTNRVCVKTFELLSKEIKTIAKELGVLPERCIEVLKGLYQKESTKISKSGEWE